MKRGFLVLGVILLMTGMASAMIPLYIGVEGGYGLSSLKNDELYMDENFHGFEVTPIIGTYFFGRSLGVEANVQMMFQSVKKNTISGISAGDIKINVFTPQIVAVYNFTMVPYVQPYLGLGAGVNFTLIDVNEPPIAGATLKTNPSFSLVIKGGLRYSIPNTNFLLLAFGKYNLNFANLTMSSEGFSETHKVSLGTFSFGLGVGYFF